MFVIQAGTIPLYHGSGAISIQYPLHANTDRIEIHYRSTQRGLQTVTAGIDDDNSVPRSPAL